VLNHVPPAVLAALLLVTAGCATKPGGGQLAQYRLNVDPSAIVFPAQPESGVPAGGGQASTASAPEVVEEPVVPAVPAGRTLRRGERLQVSLRGIPDPEDLVVEIDEHGCITLPLAGPVRVEGTTSSGAERIIENAMVSGGYYKRITVIVVSQEDEYFVQGEVRNQGRFPLSVEMTLLKAIAAAGGYTDYAKPSKVRVVRGAEVLYFDAEAIVRRREPDPPVKRGDIIFVERRIIL